MSGFTHPKTLHNCTYIPQLRTKNCQRHFHSRRETYHRLTRIHHVHVSTPKSQRLAENQLYRNDHGPNTKIRVRLDTRNYSNSLQNDIFRRQNHLCSTREQHCLNFGFVICHLLTRRTHNHGKSKRSRDGKSTKSYAVCKMVYLMSKACIKTAASLRRGCCFGCWRIAQSTCRACSRCGLFDLKCKGMIQSI